MFRTETHDFPVGDRRYTVYFCCNGA